MENNEQTKTIKEHILATIESGQVKMRPRWHFALKAMLAALGGIILGLTVLYLASFIIFILRQTGVLFVPAFGWEGWFAFFTHLPIFLIILVIVFIIGLELLVRHCAFAYRRPLLYSAFGIFVLVIFGALAVVNSHLHGNLAKYANDNKDTFVGRFYVDYSQQRFPDVHRGMIIEMTNNGFVMRDPGEESLTVFISRRTRLPFGADFSDGDIVVVFGSRDDGSVQAFGVQEIDAGLDY